MEIGTEILQSTDPDGQGMPTGTHDDFAEIERLWNVSQKLRQNCDSFVDVNPYCSEGVTVKNGYSLLTQTLYRPDPKIQVATVTCTLATMPYHQGDVEWVFARAMIVPNVQFTGQRAFAVPDVTRV